MTEKDNPSLAARTVKGSVYSVSASGVTLLLGMIRSILMASFLVPEQKQVAALALIFTSLVSQFSDIGLKSAFIHRKDADETVRRTYFTLNLMVTGSGFVLLGLVTPWVGGFYPDMPELSLVMWVYIAMELFRLLVNPQNVMLNKRLAFGKLASMDVASSVVMTIVGPVMAWQGFGVWSIVAESFSGVLVRGMLLLTVYKPWNIRLGLDKETVRWFGRFGARVWMSTNFMYLLDHFDDFWVGTALVSAGSGKAPLGLYTQAYDFARYPRSVVASPILAVFFPTFAHIQDDRLRLSRAFFRATSLMVRAGCLFSLVFILTAPEFIALIGEQWLPMVTTFQLMIVYTLLDPISIAAHNLLIATGHPGLITRTRTIQAIVFIPAVIVFAGWGGIEGVALAADLMVLVGAILFFRDTHRVTDYSHRALWLWPLVGLVLTGSIVIGLNPVWNSLNIWFTLIGKIALIPIIFGGLLYFTERDNLLVGWQMIWGLRKSLFPAKEKPV